MVIDMQCIVQKKTYEYPAFDRFRLIAAFLVVGIHTAPFSGISGAADDYVTYCIGRIAVPFFLMLTGFFVLSEGAADGCAGKSDGHAGVERRRRRYYRKVLRMVGKLAAVYGGVTLLYLPVTIYAGNLPKTAGALFVWVLLDGTFYHLSVSPYTRNGIFFTPLFLWMGAALKKYHIHRSGRHIAAYLAVSLAAMLTAFPFVFYLAVCTASFIFGVCCFFAGGLMRSALHKTARAQMAVHAVIPVRGRRYGRTETSRAWAELDRENLKKNVEFFQKLSGADAKLMPAVKANAYGHGALLVVQELQRLGIYDFCVATAEEGAALREAGIRGQILVLGFTAPEAFWLLMRYDLTQTVVDSAYASLLGGSGRTLKVHVGVDTGMHRLGIPWEDIEAVKQVWNYRNLRVTGVFSHLCAADEQSSAAETFTRLQIERFQAVREALLAAGLRNFKVHLLSSYGILNYPAYHCDYVRCGIALYGILSCGQDVTKVTPQISPVLSLKARIGCIRAVKAGEGAGYGMEYRAKRDSRIAVLSIGYADGIPREIAGRGHVLIAGKIAPVVGRICMDQMLCDVTDIPEAEPCGEAVLIGNSGARCITAEQYAGWADTISNEVVSRLGERLKRGWK